MALKITPTYEEKQGRVSVDVVSEEVKQEVTEMWEFHVKETEAGRKPKFELEWDTPKEMRQWQAHARSYAETFEPPIHLGFTYPKGDDGKVVEKCRWATLRITDHETWSKRKEANDKAKAKREAGGQ